MTTETRLGDAVSISVYNNLATAHAREFRLFAIKRYSTKRWTTPEILAQEQLPLKLGSGIPESTVYNQTHPSHWYLHPQRFSHDKFSNLLVLLRCKVIWSPQIDLKGCPLSGCLPLFPGSQPVRPLLFRTSVKPSSYKLGTSWWMRVAIVMAPEIVRGTCWSVTLRVLHIHSAAWNTSNNELSSTCSNDGITFLETVFSNQGIKIADKGERKHDAISVRVALPPKMLLP